MLKYLKKYRSILIILLIAVFLECFIFNFRFWESHFYKPVSAEWSVTGMIASDEGFEVTDPEGAGIEFSEINAHVDNVFLDISVSGRDIEALSINIYMTDDGHALYTMLSDTEIVPKLKESKYIRVHLQGDSRKILIRFKDLQNGYVCRVDAALNVRAPFLFRWWRLLLIILVLGLLYVFRPGSFIYEIRLDLKKGRQLLLTCLFAAFTVIFYAGVTHAFRVNDWEKNETWMQYNYLAQSLAKGQTYLDIEPPAALADMEDPYDCALRAAVLDAAGESYILDYAYHDGKYYCYFGVVPVILFYLPYYLITGKALNTSIPVFLMTAVFICAAFWFMASVIKKYFANTSFGLYILLTSVLIAGSGLTYGAAFAVIYSLPITMAIAFDLIGITCWLRAVRDDGTISKAYLIIGAVFIALVIGCRPQLAAALLLAFPIFRGQIRERKFFSISGIGNTLSVVVPFLVIGAGLMYYNYVRFGNPVDFGATYNLTGFDMTHRGIDMSRFGLGFFEYLFQPFRVTAKFPYVLATSPHLGMISDYQGEVMNETFFAGFFWFNVFGVFIFRLFGIKSKLKEKGILGFSLLCMILGLMIIAVDIQVVGIIFRYLTDFSMFLLIPAVIAALSLSETAADKREKNRILKWIVVLGMITIAVNYYTLIATDRFHSLYYYNPLMYYRIKYQLFSFMSIR